MPEPPSPTPPSPIDGSDSDDLDGKAAVHYFGISVDLSADGKRLAVGDDAGHVRVFAAEP